MRRVLVRLTAWACLLTLLGCGGRSTSLPGAEGSGRGGSENQGATGNEGATGGMGATSNFGATSSIGATSNVGATGNVSGGGPRDPKCGLFEDEAAWTMLVRFRNQTARTLHLGQVEVTCGFEPLFHVADPSGVALTPIPYCTSSCSQVMSTGHVSCPDICNAPSALSLAPGEMADVAWDGLYATNVTLPPSCLSDAARGSPDCLQLEHVQRGEHFFWADAGTAIDCVETGAPCGACSPRPGGGCVTNAALIGGAFVTAKVLIELDPAFGIDQPDPYDGWVPRPIELVFVD